MALETTTLLTPIGGAKYAGEVMISWVHVFTWYDPITGNYYVTTQTPPNSVQSAEWAWNGFNYVLRAGTTPATGLQLTWQP